MVNQTVPIPPNLLAEDVDDQIENDSVSTIAKFPEIPVGGRLSHFFAEWQKITNDQWVLDIIQNGYKLEFIKKPPFLGIKHTKVNSRVSDLIGIEIQELLKKNAIETVHPTMIRTGFYSTLFLVTKKNGEMRPVINLKPLNMYLKKTHFKMDTMKKVLNLVRKGDWAFSLDLKDAYFHIPIHKKHRKYLRFCYKGIVYQFRALCFGPTVAPRVFTKITAVVAAHLRKQSIRLLTYLDDWLSINQSKHYLIQNRTTMLNLLFELGFIVNKKKSNLVPSQSVTYIGGQFALDKGLVFPTPERVAGLKMSAKNLLLGQNTARDYLIFLGKIASCLDLIPNARLFMRPIQLHLLQNWSPIRMSFSHVIPVSHSLKYHLQWWLQEVNILKGCGYLQSQTNVSITTDASSTWGWGGHMNSLTVQGRWTPLQQLQHINCLEMEAVIRTVRHFLPRLKHKNVLIRSDNMTVVQYINKQGGTKSLNLCQKTWDLWTLALANGMSLKAAHIAGDKNILADALSRYRVKETEWSLNKTVVRKVFSILGFPMMDLFATIENKQTQLFCTWIPHPAAYAVDALSIAWTNMYAYAFPPIKLIPRVLSHMQKYQCTLILIAPNWPRQHWFPILLQMLIAQPLILPVQSDLLSQVKGRIVHPRPEILNLTAWLISTDTMKQEAFQKNLENYWQPHGDWALRKTIDLSSKFSVIGVVNNKLIHTQHL
jgi:hypothetical protein